MQNVLVHNQLGRLESISLKGLDKVKLLNRVDRKYIIPISGLSRILRILNNNGYSVLEIDGRRTFNYQTTYFDTSDYRFYKDHHNSRPGRIKVRIRSYEESNRHFFEIKLKSNLRTKKYREVLSEPGYYLSDTQSKKVKNIYSRELISSLAPSLINSYTRITLVNKAKTERCTIDLNLSYCDPKNPEKEMSVSDIAIIEVKQSKTSVLNGIIASLKQMRISPSGISKYVVGLILTHPEIKHNSFKPLLHKIDKIKTQQIAFL